MSLVNPGIIGGLGELEALVQEKNIDRVVLSLKEQRGRMPYRELLRLKFAGVTVEDAHTVFERISGRIALEKLSPSWLIFNDGFRKSRSLLAAKRAHGYSCRCFVRHHPHSAHHALVAAAILIESGGPCSSGRQRVGLQWRAV